jgi:hypothetical protein
MMPAPGPSQLDTTKETERSPDQLGGIRIIIYPPAEILIVDPLGRKTGLLQTGGNFYEEIPNSVYQSDISHDDVTGERGEEWKELEIMQPAAGTYRLYVTGTGAGTYMLGIAAWDPELTSSSETFKDVPITPGEVHTVRFHYIKDIGAKTTFAFSRNGEKPRDDTKVLGYSAPLGPFTDLPPGSKIYVLSLRYGDAIVPSSFKAEWNGKNITSIFHPVQGSSEKVTLDLKQGQNGLVLSVDANIGGQITNYSDGLQFHVP